MPFNSCLKCRIQKEKRIRWLDFVDDLIYKDDDGNFHVKNKYSELYLLLSPQNSDLVMTRTYCHKIFEYNFCTCT